MRASVSFGTPGLELDDSKAELGPRRRRRRRSRAVRGFLGRGERLLVGRDLPRLHRLELFRREDALAHETPRVERPHARMLRDLAVHDRLRVRRLVALVVAMAAEADQVDDDVLVELLAVVERDLEDAVGGLGIVAVDVEDRDLVDLRDVGRVDGGPAGRRRRRESDLVVDDDVDRAARPVAGELRQVEDLRHDPLPRERCVAVEQQRQHPLPRFLAVADPFLLRADHAFDDGVHGLEVRRVRRHGDRDAAPALARALRPRALVVLDVALVGREIGVHRPLEAGEDALGRVADDVRHDVQASAVRHPENDLADAAARGALDETVEERNRRVAALDGIPPLPEELRPQEALEILRGDELLEDLPAHLRRERLRRRADAVANPLLLLGARDVAVLDPHLAAVGAAHHRDDVAQRHVVAALKSSGPELAVEVPDRQAIGLEIELGMRDDRPEAQRVDVGDEMPADTVRVDEREDLRLLRDLGRAAVGEKGGIPVHRPAVGPVRNLELREDSLVEAVLAEEELLDARQEAARLGALDDPVVVRRGEGRDLADGQARERRGRGRAKLRRELDRPGRDDERLSRHETRDRRGRAERARVRERDGRPFEVGDLKLGGAGARHDVVHRRGELREGHRLRALDVRHEEGTGTVRLLDVHREAETDGVAAHARRRSRGTVERVVQPRERLDRLDDRPGHELREGDLALIARGAKVVDEAAIFLEEAHRNLALRRRRRDRERGLHVLRDAERRPADRSPVVAGDCGGRRGGRGRGGGSGSCGRRAGRRLRLAEALAEERAPLLVHASGVRPIAGEELRHVARVLAELGREIGGGIDVAGAGRHGRPILCRRSRRTPCC